jgi:predicted MPP superfamily phosphohydrolase
VQKPTFFDEPVEIQDPVEDVLEHGWLHKVMVLAHQPEGWPDWLLAGWLILMAAFLGRFWLFTTGEMRVAQMVLLVQILVMAADMALLISLPKREISYGPWKAQFVVLSLPRFGVTFATAVLAAFWNPVAMWVVFLVVQLLALAALIWGTEIEPFRLRMSEFVLFSNRLPAGSKPIRLLHITDLHVERLTRREERVVMLAKKAKADLIVITGDYVNLSYNRDPETLQQVRQLLRRFQAPQGVFATLGSPPVDLRETVVPIFQQLPVQLMRHEWQRVTLGDGRSLVLLGIDCTHHLPTDAQRLAQLVADAPDDAPQVLLYHSPELMPEAIHHELDLYLCGHTHGGQVRLPLIGPLLTSSQLGRRYVMGLYKYGRTHLYVSRGIGLEGLSAPRVRFMCPPEMTLVTIRPLSPHS